MVICTEMCNAKPLVLNDGAMKLGLLLQKLKQCKSPGNGQIFSELIQVGWFKTYLLVRFEALTLALLRMEV